MPTNKELMPIEKETNLSRRKFLKMAGLAAGAVVTDRLISKTLAETIEIKDAVEASGKELPKFVQEAIKQNNRKHNKHFMLPDDVIYIVQWQKYADTKNSVTTKEKEIMSKSLAYFKNAPEPKIYVVGDSTLTQVLREQSRAEGCGELIQVMFNGVIIHEATHFHSGDEEAAYNIQVKYLEEQERRFKAIQSTGRYSQQFFVYLHNYIKQYQERLEGIKTGKYPRSSSKL